jgi:HAD superfamily hydrolase (TIGR01549 family)
LIDLTEDLKNIRGLLFDLDGTLLDSFPVHYAAYHAMFARLGIHIEDEQFLATYSPNWFLTYEAMGVPREQWEQADRIWMEEALKHTPQLFPDMPATLAQLRAAYRIGIVTSGERNRVLADLEGTGVLSAFEVIITGSDVQARKPAPEGLELALRQMGLRPDEALYVGDTPSDYEMARAAGVRFVYIPSQFTRLKADTACYRAESVAELARILSS